MAIGGSWNTLSEMALAKVYGKPVLGLLAPEVGGVERADSLEEVVPWLEARARELGFRVERPAPHGPGEGPLGPAGGGSPGPGPA